jgi:outer membrane protein OmpA-like peptidoglycan-associated protein
MQRNIALTVLISIVLAGCASEGGSGGFSNRPLTNTETGALIGAGIGGVIGAVAYSRDRTDGAVAGIVGGGLAGGAVGAYMDGQKKDLEKNLANEIKAGQARVETMPNHVVRITMTNQTAFDTNSSDVKAGFTSTLDKVADVVVRYGKTTLTIVGHTDNVGSNDFNQKLSERRAHAVAQEFEAKRVNPLRLAISGKGETQPIANNSSEAGRQANRRVEIYVEPVVQG